MGTIQIQRTQSACSLALETTPGQANITAAIHLPFMENTMRGHHEPFENISARTTRIMDADSKAGRKWAEGDVQILCDTHNSGYLWKLALGNELLDASGTPEYHTFYTTVSGNAPKTATIINTRGDNDIEQYTYASVDELTFEVSDGLATLNASIQAQFPTAGAAQTPTTTSGTVLAFRDYFVQFGNTVTVASTAVATPLNEFSLTIANNLEVIHRSGHPTVSTIRTKGIRVTGSYTLFFDDVTDRDRYYNLGKTSMIVTASGIGNESIRIRIPELRVQELDVSTGLDDFFMITANFVAEDDVDSGTRLLDVRLANDKGSVY